MELVMFSFLSRTHAYDARNPICAPIFHRVYDNMQGKGASRKAFDTARVRTTIDSIYSSGKLSVKNGLLKAEQDFCMLTCNRLYGETAAAKKSDMVEFFTANEMTLGVDSGMRHVRDMVFGAAPALSTSPSEVYELTIRMAFCLKGLLASHPSPYVHSAGQMFMVFGMEFDGKTLIHQPEDFVSAKLDAWERGYKAAA